MTYSPVTPISEGILKLILGINSNLYFRISPQFWENQEKGPYFYGKYFITKTFPKKKLPQILC